MYVNVTKRKAYNVNVTIHERFILLEEILILSRLLQRMFILSESLQKTGSIVFKIPHLIYAQ